MIVGRLDIDAVAALTQAGQGTPSEREGATRCAARHARDADDLSELLDALGLTPPAKGDQ